MSSSLRSSILLQFDLESSNLADVADDVVVGITTILDVIVSVATVFVTGWKNPS